MKKYHSNNLNKDFIIKSDGGIRFKDKVKYSVKEVQIIKKNHLDRDELEKIHLLKKFFPGRISKISGSVKTTSNPLLDMTDRIRAAVETANQYHNNGYNMSMAIHKAAQESQIDKTELAHHVGKFAAWVKGEKK